MINNVFTKEETDHLVEVILLADTFKPNFSKTNTLFAIRQFLKEVPASAEIIFNNELATIISTILGKDFFVVKSVYFDKREEKRRLE